MGSLARTVKRGIWTAMSPIAGSSHEQYRQALWFPTRQELDADLAVSETFGGIDGASKWNRRTWDHLGVIAVRNGALDRLISLPGMRPAVAFANDERLVAVGELVDTQGFGYMQKTQAGELVPGDMAHGFRLGPDDARFAVGAVAPNGRFLTPMPEDIYTMGPIGIGDIGPDSQSGFANIYFS